jgi:DNA polymerase I-like protein with 3'-5' exonuclease and polymerase domains
LNNAINAPIQGGAADCTKTALATFRKACYDRNLPFPVVNVVHDEIVVDIPKDGYPILPLLDRIMCDSAHGIYDSVPFRVEKSVGKDWGAKS